MKRHSARGMTFVELLLLIAVLALVGMILLSAWLPMHEPYSPRTCLTNCQQIGLAVAMYSQDWDDTLPWNPGPGGLPASNWEPPFQTADCAAQPTTSFVALLLPYIKDPFVFQCPRYSGYDLSRHLGYAPSLIYAAAGLRRDSSYARGLDPSWIHYIGYGFNEVLIASPCRPRTLSSLHHAAREVALFSDAEQPWASSRNSWAKVNGKWDRYWGWNPRTGKRHKSWDAAGREFVGQNFVYADGHAKFRSPTASDVEQVGKQGRSGYYPDAKLE